MAQEHGPGASAARPATVTTAAVLLFIAGGLNVIFGILLFTAGTLGVISGLISLAVAAAAIYAGVQIMNLRAEGRTVGLVVAIIGLVLGLITVIGQGNWFALVGVALWGFVVWALWTTAEVFRS